MISAPVPDPGEKAENAELERRLRQTLQRGEHAEDQDAERQRAHPADIIGDDAEREAAERPAQQPRRADEPADPPDIGGGRVPPISSFSAGCSTSE